MSTFKIFLRFSGPLILFVILISDLEGTEWVKMILSWGVLVWTFYWIIQPNGIPVKKKSKGLTIIHDAETQPYFKAMPLCYTFLDGEVKVYSNKPVYHYGQDLLQFKDGSFVKANRLEGVIVQNKKSVMFDLYVVQEEREVFPCHISNSR